jgi:hypothetical protein
METSLVLILLLFAALATGGLMVNWIGLGRAMLRTSVSAYVEFHQHTNHTFDPYMPTVVVGALAGGIALAVRYGIHSTSGQLAAAGAVGYALVLFITLPTNLRINHQIESWSIQNPPREWDKTRARWIRFHVIRTLFSVPAFAIYVLAVTSNISHQ